MSDELTAAIDFSNRVNYCQDMVGRLPDNLDCLTDEEIERRTTKQLHQRIKGRRIVFWGIDLPGPWVELGPGDKCNACQSGRAIAKFDLAICIACARATKLLEQYIQSVLKEQHLLSAQTKLRKLIALKARAHQQRLKQKPRPGRGNFGARPGQSLNDSLNNRRS